MWRKFFSHSWCIPVLALLGVLLTAPTLGTGLFADDFIHRSLLIGETQAPHAGSPFGLFNFMDGQPAHNQALRASGRLLWWAGDTIRLSFWRPLTELTHWLDYQLWPSQPVLMHAQNLLWYGLLIVLLGRLYRQLNPNRVEAGLATLLFAISSLHMQVVGWIAARNQLIAACFMVLTLMAFHTWRTQRSTIHAWLAAACLAMGMMSAEAAIATMGYLLAYLLVFEQGKPLHQRLRALLPFIGLIVVWRLLYTHLSFGSSGSGAYIDPGVSLSRFGTVLLVRLPTLMLSDLLRIPAGVINGWSYTAQLQYAAGAAGVIALFAALGQHFKLWASPLARFQVLGAALALIPVCAAEPSDRLLLNAEIGLCGVVATLFCLVVRRHQRQTSAGWLAKGATGLAALMMGLHLVVAPVQTLGYSLMMDRLLSPSMVGEPLSLPNDSPEHQDHVILLNPPKPSMLFYYPFVRQQFGIGNAASTQALGVGTQHQTVRVIDESTIELSGRRGFIDSMSRDVVVRPFKVGDQINIGQVDVTVIKVSPEGVPLTARFHFKAPLRDPRWRFYAWTEDGYTPFVMPALGQQVKLLAIDPRQMVMRRLSLKASPPGVPHAAPARVGSSRT